MSGAILPFVEGKGELDAVPLLLRRCMFETMEIFDIPIAKPVLIKRNRIVKPGELEKELRVRVSERLEQGYVVKAGLVLLDSDDDCPVEVARTLEARATAVDLIPVRVVLAHREFESWFLGAKESLRGSCGIRSDAEAPETPESIRGAKERISDNMSRGRRYVATAHQRELVGRMDLALCQDRCPSFRMLLTERAYLVGKAKEAG